jgi:translocation and assembly module TamB
MNWKKIVGLTLAGMAALILIAAVGGYFYLRSTSFQQFALRRIVTQVDQSTGGRTQIRALDFQLSTLTAHLYGIVIRGTEEQGASPLLQIDKLTIGLKIKSIIRRQINLSELLIEHPVLNIEVDRHGNSNIPQARSNNGSKTNIFDLAVRHTALSHGEINYNDRKTPLDADLHDLRTEINFESQASRYRGSISYDNGHLHYDSYAPLAHALTASFSATPSIFKLESAVIKVASSSFKLAGDVTNYSSPTVQGSYDVRVHSQDVAELLHNVNPAGDLSSTGTFDYQYAANESLLHSLRVDGDMTSNVLVATVSNGRLEIRRLNGKYQLADGALRASGVDAEILGGRFSASLDMEHLDGNPSSQLQAELHGVSLSAAQRVFRNPELRDIAISGTLEGVGKASWKGSVSNAYARIDAVISNLQRSGSNVSDKDIPITGAIHAIYDAPKSVLTLHQTTLNIPDTTVTAEGEISKHSRLNIRASSDDLHRLVVLGAIIHPMANGTPAVSGSATLTATLEGSLQTPQISAHLNGNNLQVQGSEWKTADLTLQASPSGIFISNGSLMNAHRGHSSFDAKVALRNWSYVSSDPIEAHLSLRQMPISDLQHLANVQYPISGELSAKLFLSGSELNPQGSGSVEIANARAYDEPLKALSFTFHGDKGSIVSDLHVSADAGTADASLTFAPQTKAYKLHLDAPAIVLQKLRTVQAKNIAMQGTVAIAASGEGTIEDPQLTASIRLPKLEVQQKSIAGVVAEVRVANKQADLSVDSQVAQASIRAHGHVDLTGEYQTEASLDTSSIPLETLLATFSNRAPEGFSGQAEVHATLKGPLKNKSQLEAHLVVPTLSASYQSLQIGAASPIRADYSNSVITIRPSEIKGTGTSLSVQGSIPIGGTSAPHLTAKGSIDAHIFRIFAPALRSSGTIALDVRATGSASNPQLAGQMQLRDIAFATDAVPLGVDKLNGTLDLDSERMRISNLTAEVGGGQISMGGSVEYRPQPQFNIALKANSVRLRYPDGVRTVLDGNLAWLGTTNASVLRGNVLVDSLSFTPDFDLSTFGDQFESNAAAPAVPGFTDTISLQIALQSKEKLSATSSQISVEGSANLNVNGTAANPVITGRTDLTAGELFYRNVRYQLQRGIITFSDPNETKPNLDVSVTTIVEQYNLTLNLRGPFDALTTSYSSDPPLATADIINLIARGKTSSELAASSQSTDSMIASQAVSELGGSVQKMAGISSLEIDPAFGGNGQNPSTRVGIQQRVTKNFLFTFSTDVSQPGEEIVEGDYQINKRWSVSVARDQLGGVSVDGRFHTKF